MRFNYLKRTDSIFNSNTLEFEYDEQNIWNWCFFVSKCMRTPSTSYLTKLSTGTVVLHYFPFVISSWPFYDNFCTIRTEQKHYYRTVREYGFDSTSCSNHMQLFYTLTTTRARQRLSGSTLLFGFGFFKSPFPAGIMWIFVSWIPAEVRGWSWLLIGSFWFMTYWRMFCVCDCYDCQTLHFREKCIKTSLFSHEGTYSWLYLRA